MVKRNRLRNGRIKAAFGVDGAIMAGATLAAAAMNAASTANAAKQQAAAITASAQTNADALIKQNENNNTLQEKSLAFTKEQNEVNRDLQKDIQMNLQILAGQQNVNQMRDMARTQVKTGGSVRRKLRNGASLLQGREDKLPGITTPNKGKYVPIDYTRDGVLSVLEGPDHKEGGININVNGEPVINAEGNELMEVKYGSNIHNKPVIKDVRFLSKHKLPGTSFNPAEAVLSGVMTPDESFEYQELLKDIYGISDDGKRSSNSPVRRMATSGAAVAIPIVPDLSLDFLAPVATGIVAGTRQLKCGGRHKAAYGFNFKRPPYNNMDWFNTTNWNGAIEDYNIPQTRSMTVAPTITRPTLSNDVFSNNYHPTTTKSGMTTAQGNLLGAGINAGSNLLAAGIGMIGNAIGARRLGNAYVRSGEIMANAYRNLKGIDLNLIDKTMFAPAHVMTALQAPLVNTGAERSAAERSLQRNLGRINRGTLSSAAAQNRSARAEVDYNDRIAQIESNAEKIRQDIINRNFERMSRDANENANREVQANNARSQARLQALIYNADINNEIEKGVAESITSGIMGRESTLANMRAANAQSLANAINTGGNAFGSAFATNAKMQNELEMSRYGWTPENDLNYTIKNGDIDTARIYYKRYKKYKGTGNQYDIWAKQLEDAFGESNLNKA